MPIFYEAINCQDCPCLSHEERESACNLGSAVDLKWTRDRTLIDCAESCPLEYVALKDGTRIFPVTCEVTQTRPERWLE